MQAELDFDSTQWQRCLKKLQDKWDYIMVGTSKVRYEFSTLISIYVFKDIIKHFDDEKGPEGPWQEWSTAYAAHLTKIGRGGNRKLQFSGKLRQSFYPSSFRSTNEGVMFYNNAKTSGGFPYAKAHNDGGSKKGRPPQRQFMWLSSSAVNDIVRATQDWMKEGFN